MGDVDRIIAEITALPMRDLISLREQLLRAWGDEGPDEGGGVREPRRPAPASPFVTIAKGDDWALSARKDAHGIEVRGSAPSGSYEIPAELGEFLPGPICWPSHADIDGQLHRVVVQAEIVDGMLVISQVDEGPEPPVEDRGRWIQEGHGYGHWER